VSPPAGHSPPSPWLAVIGYLAATGAFAQSPASPIALPAVTVAGDRFERSHGLVPESHAAFGRAALGGMVTTDALGALGRVANTSVGFARNTPFAIRGVGNDSVTPGLLGRVAHVAEIYYEQVAATPTQVDYFLPTLWDVANLAVLRGPISTGHGTNALIGGLFVNYAEPVFTPEGRLRLRAASRATYEAAVTQNFPLAANRLALRFAAEHRAGDGSARNVTRRTDEWMRLDQDHLRGQLRWQPGGNDDLRIDLLWRHEVSDSPTGATVRALGPNGSFFDRLADANVATDAHASGDLALLTVRRRLSREATLEFITAWQGLRTRDVFDLDFTALPLAFGHSGIRERSLAQELQWRRASDRWQLLAGGHFEATTHDRSYVTFLSLPGLPGTATNAVRIDGDTAAAFGQAVWQFAPAWTLEAGLRAQRASRIVAMDNRTNGFGLPTRAQQRDHVLSPRASVTWTPRGDLHAGVLVSHGFRSGGISNALIRARTQPYGPEHAWNYEVFLRGATTDGRLWTQANAYFMDWRQQQVSMTLPGGVPGPDDVVFNAGRSRLHGFEWEAGWRFAPRATLTAMVGHQATRLVEFVNGGANYAGHPFPNAPPWSAALAGGFGLDDHSPGWFGSAALTWRDVSYSLIGLRDFSALEARTLLSGQLGWRWRNGLSLFVQGENLLDDDFAYTRIDRRIFGVPGPVGRASEPRSLGVGAEFAW
jgi:iron complex outermembrane receptor protein